MSHAVTTQYLNTSASPESNKDVSYTRPTVERQSTSDILEYYNSPEASAGYSAADLAHSRASNRRPATAPSTSAKENEAPHSPVKDEQTGPKQSSTGSIRLVTPNPNKNSTRRPSLHHADSINVVMDNRRVAIIERDASPPQVPPKGTPSTPATGHGNSPTSLMARRGVDHSRLALVAPPDAAPSSYAIQSSPPSAAAFALSKSSRSKYAETRASPVSPVSYSPSSHSNQTTSSGHGHTRSSSENTTPVASHSSKSPVIMGGSSSGDGFSNSSRGAGIAGTSRHVSRPSDQHGRERSASSGSDYGDEAGSKTSTVDHSATPRWPKASKQTIPLSNRPPVPETAGGMHLPMPAGPRYFGSSAGTTPLLTPAIGDGKRIDLKVAAPVVVDIKGDLADLWLAATPDADQEPGSSMGSPITAITTTTDSSSMPTSFSPTSSLQSSVTSHHQHHPHHPHHSQSLRRDHSPDAPPGVMQIPPRHIDVNSLSSNALPVCPPRPQRQPSPIKGRHDDVPRDGHERASSSTIGPEEHAEQSREPASSKSNSVPAEDPDAKYSLATVSDDESNSEYSNDAHASRHTRSRATANPPSLIKNGSIHIREGAFPPQSVFLERGVANYNPTAPDPDMKTPTARHDLENMFQNIHVQPARDPSPEVDRSATRASFDTNEADSLLSSSYHSGSKMSHGRASSELPARRSRPGTPESTEEDAEPAILIRSASLRPSPPSKDPEDILRRFVKSGKKVGGEDPSITLHPDSSVESSIHQRQYANTHLGHGPPPSSRTHQTKAPSAFKAKGPRATSQSLRSNRKRVHVKKERSMWPSAMSFADVLAEQTALARARGYATKLNELATEDCGLSDWIDSVISRTQPVVMTTHGPVPVGQNRRLVSGSSAQSETTFPIRPDAYKAIDITPGGGEFTSSEVPSSLPYQALARQQTGSRSIIPPITPNRTGLGSVVSGSATFLATLGRKASMRSRGSQSATESRDKESKSTPRKLVSTRSPAYRQNGTPPMPSTPLSTVGALPPTPVLPSAPTIPGGPRAQRPKRASTMMVPGTRPIISAPIPIPPHSNSDPIPTSTPAAPTTEEPDNEDAAWLAKAVPLNLTKDVPRPPEGPRPPSKIARTPSFPGPGSTRVSANGNMRSTMSFRPLGMNTTGGTSKVTQSDVGIGMRRPERTRNSNEFDRQLNKLCDVLPHVSRDTLAVYLTRADGQNMVAIGRYLEDERQGTILRG